MLIDQLPTLASPISTDEIPIERGTTTYKTTIQKFLSIGVETDETISNIADAAIGCTITSAKYAQWGKVAMIEIAIQKTTAVTSNATTTLATLKSGKLPVVRSAATLLSGQQPLKAYIHTNGSVAVYGTISADQTMTIASIYLLP